MTSPSKPLGQLVLVEARAAIRSKSSVFKIVQFERQQVAVPLGKRGRLVVGDAVGLDLRRRQVRGDVDRDLLQAELLRRLPARVADDDHAVGVDDDRLPEAEFPDRRGDRVDSVVVDAGILGIGLDVRRASAARSSWERTLGTGVVLVAPRCGVRPRQSRAAGRRTREACLYVEFILPRRGDFVTRCRLRVVMPFEICQGKD